jgi:hypothetical protein
MSAEKDIRLLMATAGFAMRVFKISGNDFNGAWHRVEMSSAGVYWFSLATWPWIAKDF